MTGVLIGPIDRLIIADLVDIAGRSEVDMQRLILLLETEAGKAAHREQMTRQSILLPPAWMVTYSIEVGHPCGKCRHMSVSLDRPGRGPRPEAIWMIAEAFGFQGSLQACATWLEQLSGHGLAVNVVQPFPS